MTTNTETDNSPLFYQANTQLPLVSHADGVYLWDQSGKRYLDGCSGAITCNLGHNHPKIKAAMKAQLDKVAFSYRTQFESSEAIELASMLADMTDRYLNKVFFVGSGSEAVESAIKLARQYFFATNQPQRTRFVSLTPSYHGSTLGALGLTSYFPLEEPFEPITNTAVKVPSPDLYRYTEATLEEHIAAVLAETEKRIEAVGGDTIAAIVIEPVGGASTGARMLTQQYFEGIRALCDRYGCLLIFDEVLAGMGRTGQWLAYQNWDVKPDIVSLAKGLGAGYYPIAAILSRGEIVNAVMASGGFQHGHTYAGNPMACATGVAIMRTMLDDDIIAKSRETGAYLGQQLHQLAEKHPIVGHVRGIGMLYGMELVQDRDTKEPWPAELNLFNKVTQIAKSKGLLIYPRRTLNGIKGDHFLVCPPLTITPAEIDTLIQLLDETLTELRSSL
ncbi:aspartate aminotransferase family protein [Paenalcaligenes sp. Me131]|uniref:aminotransferase family protein n=1 Tax=Paenalcaligenes sp. Me131 TaxID=3392636 RepID=UPI003D276454